MVWNEYILKNNVEQAGISARLQRLKQADDMTLPLDWWGCETPNKVLDKSRKEQK